MTSREIASQETKRSETISTRKSTSLHQARAIGFSIGLFTLPLALFSIVQYFRYGSGLFLGWDTSTYVWSAQAFYAEGAQYLFRISYPNLYVIILAGFGTLVGQTSVAERILPFIVALPLGYAYYRLTLEITSDRRLGYLAALLGGLTINTLRLESDLNRNLLSYSVSMILGILVSYQLGRPHFSWRTNWKRAFLLWLPLLAVVAYTQIETYLVLSLSLLLLFSFTRNVKATAFVTSLLSVPVILALSLIWPFLSNYAAGIALIGFAPQSPLSILATAALFLGGLALPWTALGLVTISRKAQKGSQASLFIVSWLAALVILLPIAIVLGLPYDRFLYVVPVPMIIASGAKSIRVRTSLSSSNTWLWKLLARMKLRVPRNSLLPFGLALLLIATLATSIAATDTFLRPYVSQDDVNRLTQAAELLRQYGYNQPILVMYGPTAADVNSIYRAYFGINAPDNFAYYGKLQYLFTLPNPADVYAWQYDPSYEMASSTRYRAEMLMQLGAASTVASYPIVIAGGDTYDRPLSEIFVKQFETAPGSGIYIIPPNQLNASQVDYWRLYAYSDWTTKTISYVANATWTEAQQDLEYVGRGIGAHFEANYTISLAQSWAKMELTLRLLDRQQAFRFPDGSNATLAPLEILFDNQPRLTHFYGGQGPLTIPVTLQNVTSGIHTITIISASNGPTMAVVISLDELQVCPLQCS